ncbi:MAG: tyrosine-protein phosphatase [Microbacterium sp.]|uniref:tyrosine-protein phosphatase n=1 Tax=Microbacterium sp. TaxID=51671 RepID=UPI003A85CE61
MIPQVAGAVNFRDIGGLRAGSARTRSGVLFRSGSLARLEPEGVEAMRAMGVRCIIDLRADDEVAQSPSRVAALDAQTTRVPLFLGSVASFFAEDRSLDDLYAGLVDESADGIVQVVRGIVNDQPVLVHCTVGKDRTGVCIAVTLAAAGVDTEAIVADYARTESQLSPRRNRAVVAHLRSLHPEAVHLEDLATRSPARVMTTLLARLGERHGTAADYLRAHGLRDDELVELRRVLTTDQ